MLTVAVEAPGGFTVMEGQSITLDVSLTGLSGSLIYEYRLVDGSADESDYVSLSGTSSFSLFASSETTRLLPLELNTLRDRVDEDTETMQLEVNLVGAVFASGTTSEVFQIDIVDDVQQHGTNKADNFTGVAAADRYNGYSGSDVIKGLAGKDVLKGGGGADTIMGGGGRDKLIGNGKSDMLSGGNGNDKLNGGKGSDTLDGGKGRDSLAGKAGDDVFVFSKGKDVVQDFDRRGDDVIDLRPANSIEDFTDLVDNHMSEIGGNVVIKDESGNTLTLKNVSLLSLDESDFLF